MDKKRFKLFILMLFIVLFSSCRSLTPYEEAIKKGQKDGEVIAYHDNGALYMKTNLKDGKLHGKYEIYNAHNNGGILERGTYFQGKKEGEWTYFLRTTPPRIQKYGFYVNDRREGVWTSYELGSLADETSMFMVNYKNDKPEGTAVAYFLSNNELARKAFYKNEKLEGEYAEYYPNKQIKTKAFYKDGEKINLYTTYFRNGQLKSNVDYSAKESEYKEYYADGTLKKKIDYNFGRRNGEGFEYKSNGTLSVKTIYKDNKIKKELYYDEKGNITRTRLADENNELREAGKVQSFFSNIFED